MYCNPDKCSHCQYIGEGDSWCDELHEIVLSDWEPTEHYMGPGCPYLAQPRRRKALRVFKPTIKQFKDDGYISISEPPFGAFYWAEGDDLKRIREFEEQNNALVYLVVRSYTTFGKMDCYLYVSDYTEEWAQDRDDIKEMQPLAYVYNHDMPDCSEFGCIGIAGTPAAGLRRTW